MAILEHCDQCKKEKVEVEWPGITISQLDRAGVHRKLGFCSKQCVIELEKEEIKADYKMGLEEDEQSTL